MLKCKEYNLVKHMLYSTVTSLRKTFSRTSVIVLYTIFNMLTQKCYFSNTQHCLYKDYSKLHALSTS